MYYFSSCWSLFGYLLWKEWPLFCVHFLQKELYFRSSPECAFLEFDIPFVFFKTFKIKESNNGTASLLWVFSVFCVAMWIGQWIFWSENRRKQITVLEPTNDLCMWNKSQTYGHFIQSGLNFSSSHICHNLGPGLSEAWRTACLTGPFLGLFQSCWRFSLLNLK